MCQHPAIRAAYTPVPDNKKEILNKVLARTPGAITADPAFDPMLFVGTAESDLQAAGGIAGQISSSFGTASNCCLALSVGPLQLERGVHRLTYRLRMLNPANDTLTAKLYVGRGYASMFPEEIASRPITPLNFIDTDDGYKDFQLEFQLPAWTSDVAYRLDYSDGTGDLLVDLISSEALGDTGLPVLAPVFIGLVGPTTPFGTAMTLPEEDETAGGLVLAPHEFAAILNVDYMTEFARTVLGVGYPSVVEATAQAGLDQFHDALQTLRDALRDLPQLQYSISYSEGDMEIAGPFYVTDFVNNSVDRTISFVTHGPPGPDRALSLLLPRRSSSTPRTVRVDDSPPRVIETSLGQTIVRLRVDGGPHVVVVEY